MEAVVRKEKFFIVAAYGAFLGWMLAALYEAPLLYSLIQNGALPGSMPLEVSSGIFLGHLSAWLWIKTERAARLCLRLGIVTALCASLLMVCLDGPDGPLRQALWAASYITGCVVASFGFFLRAVPAAAPRCKVVAHTMIAGSAAALLPGAVAVNASASAGLFFAVLLLAAAFAASFKLPAQSADVSTPAPPRPLPLRPVLLLAAFIVIITVNSGLMFQVVLPSFARQASLNSVYGTLPYIFAIFLLYKRMSGKHAIHFLLAALAMLGFAFLAFMLLEPSLGAYLLVDTLLMAACGIFDVFWWTLLALMTDRHKNPAMVMGLGLGANLLGVLAGGAAARLLQAGVGPQSLGLYTTMLALGVICLVLSFLLPLQYYLQGQLEPEPEAPPEGAEPACGPAPAQGRALSTGLEERLTGQELRIVELLQSGRTYTMIAEELFISHNTVKFHVKNIYGKCGVGRKSDLLKLLDGK